jgi:hypothetical protein
MRRFIFVFLILVGARAWSFPEMVRHGYTQCTACHVSPTGGGILNAYGRELAAELLSTWSYDNESQFTHSKVGADLAEKGILVGGDVRALQYRYKDPNGLTGQFFLMHADIQGAYETKTFTAVASVGEVKDPISNLNKIDFNATMYYGYLKFTDEVGVRGGRFDPAFGINNPDHTIVTRNMLGSPILQFDTFEATYLTEHWTIISDFARTVQNTEVPFQESVWTANVSYGFLNRMRVGASYWQGSGDVLNRHMYGVNAILGFTDRFYNLTEIDFKSESKKDGAYGYTQLAYEVFKGIIPYLQYQHQQVDLSAQDSLSKFYGLGLHLFPRPHFEISAEWDHVIQATQNADSSWLMLHYYF